MKTSKDDYRGESAEWVGRELEEAYALAFSGQITGGYNDQGRDLITNIPETPAVQIKSSLEGAKRFFLESLRREEFIPICIGEPGAKEEMVETLKRYGAWVGYEIPKREGLLEKIAQLRKLCYSKKGLLEELAA